MSWVALSATRVLHCMGMGRIGLMGLMGEPRDPRHSVNPFREAIRLAPQVSLGNEFRPYTGRTVKSMSQSMSLSMSNSASIGVSDGVADKGGTQECPS